jgi:hypothetical protein
MKGAILHPLRNMLIESREMLQLRIVQGLVEMAIQVYDVALRRLHSLIEASTLAEGAHAIRLKRPAQYTVRHLRIQELLQSLLQMWSIGMWHQFRDWLWLSCKLGLLQVLLMLIQGALWLSRISHLDSSIAEVSDVGSHAHVYCDEAALVDSSDIEEMAVI